MRITTAAFLAIAVIALTILSLSKGNGATAQQITYLDAPVPSLTPGDAQFTISFTPVDPTFFDLIDAQYVLRWRPTSETWFNRVFVDDPPAQDQTLVVTAYRTSADSAGVQTNSGMTGDPIVNGTTYEVRICGVRGVGSNHQWGSDGVDDCSDWVEVTPVATPRTAPNAPQNVVVTPAVNSLEVSWDAPNVDANNAAETYTVDWNPGGEETGITATNHTIPNLSPGTTYTVTVTAVNSAGSTSATSVTGVPLEGPKVTSVEVDDASITNSLADITVTLTNPDSASQTVSYRYRSPPSTGTWGSTSTVTTSTTVADVSLSGLSGNTLYEFEASLDSTFTNNVASLTFETDGPPEKPVLTLIPGDGTLTANWTVDLNGGTVSAYTIEWKLSTASNFTDSANPATAATSHEISGLTNDTLYDVRLTVTTNYGAETSDVVQGTPVSGPSVSNLAFSNIQQTSATATVSLVNLNLATDAVSAHFRHRVQGTTDADWVTSSPRSVPRTSATATAVYNLANLSGNTSYEAQAVLTQGSANPNWTQSAQATFATLASPPLAPAIQVNARNGEIEVQWTAPTNDGGSPITGFVVQWKSGAQDYSDQRKHTAGPTETRYTISGLTNGRVYTVRVYATNAMGDGVVSETTQTPAGPPETAPRNFAARECNSLLRLSWKPPSSDGGSPVTSYTIQWKFGAHNFVDTERQIVTGNDELSYVLDMLENGTEYSIRVLASNAHGDAQTVVVDQQTMTTSTELVWSDEVTGTPRDGVCISQLRYGNILADSTPVTADLQDAEESATIYIRHRETGDASWERTQKSTTQPGQTSVTFDIAGLDAETEYEVQVSTSSNFADSDTAFSTFTTTAAPDGHVRGGGGALSKILRIEPSIRSTTVSPGDPVRLSVEIYGRQGIRDNGIADRAPDDGRHAFRWRAPGISIAEADIRPDWRNGSPDDRTVVATAPESPGIYEITVEPADDNACLDVREDETEQDRIARCSATFHLTVRRSSAVELETPAPVNPPGPIPETLTDADGIAYAVFTPVDGGAFQGDGIEFTAGPGAVNNGEFIGISIVADGDASNVGQTHHKFALAGSRYAVQAADAGGGTIGSYVLGEPATICLPLPDELRSGIDDLAILATEDGSFQVLSTRVRITPGGVVVCGAVSRLPVTVAVGARGAPQPIPVEPVESDSPGDLPDTGGAALGRDIPLLLFVIGASIAVFAIARRIGHRHRRFRN